MEKKTILAASLAGMFALSLATGCNKQTAETPATDVSTVQAETTQVKDACNGKDGCSAKATADATTKDGCNAKDGCDAKAEKDSCKAKDSCKSETKKAN
jgi:hypothetical protein